MMYDTDFTNWDLLRQCPLDKGYIEFFKKLKEWTPCVVLYPSWDPRDPSIHNMIMYYRGFEEYPASNEYVPSFTFLRDKDTTWEWTSRLIMTFNQLDEIRNAGLLLYAKLPPPSVQFILGMDEK